MAKKTDWLLRFAWLMLLIAGMMLISYYYIFHVNKCTLDPLGYYTEGIEREYGSEFNYSGLIFLKGDKKGFLIEFNSSNKTIER